MVERQELGMCFYVTTEKTLLLVATELKLNVDVGADLIDQLSKFALNALQSLL